MKRLPRGRHAKEFREEAVKLIQEEKLSWADAAGRLSLPIDVFLRLVIDLRYN